MDEYRLEGMGWDNSMFGWRGLVNLSTTWGQLILKHSTTTLSSIMLKQLYIALVAIFEIQSTVVSLTIRHLSCSQPTTTTTSYLNPLGFDPMSLITLFNNV
jgi:hypothetical protein